MDDATRESGATEPAGLGLGAIGTTDTTERAAGGGTTPAALAAGGVFAMASLATVGGTELSRPMLSVTDTAEAALSVVAATVVGVVVSAAIGVEAAVKGGFNFVETVSWGALVRTIQMVPTTATKATAPTPLQIRGPIGARSGFVPHQRHSPAFSG